MVENTVLSPPYIPDRQTYAETHNRPKFSLEYIPVEHCTD
jgi:hypothetical protein